jgi:hypothetical protein
LRVNAVIAERVTGTTPVDEELRRFDEHMGHVRGPAPKTRSTHLRTARRLLLEQFGDRPVVLSTITPDDVRQFVARQSELYSTADSAKTNSDNPATWARRLKLLRPFARWQPANYTASIPTPTWSMSCNALASSRPAKSSRGQRRSRKRSPLIIR